MENGTTAMTGHQDHAASGRNFNDVTDKIPIHQVLKGFGVEHIFETDTYQQKNLTELVNKAIAVEGFSVVIARHPCMLKFMREQRRKPGFERRQVSIDQDKCEKFYECVERFACPTFTRNDNGNITVNPDLCVGDGSCIQTCPLAAITTPRVE
jgi:indolepyruvate ferredoxin oxidoreductase alpha subunit